MDCNTLIIKGIPPFLNYIRAISGLRDISNRLPNLQLLEGHENVQKRAKSPDKWLKALGEPHTRRAYRDTHLLNDLPENIDDFYDNFEDFYEARRKRLKKRITSLLRG